MIVLPLEIVQDVEELATRLNTYAAWLRRNPTINKSYCVMLDIETKRDLELERRMLLRP